MAIVCSAGAAAGARGARDEEERVRPHGVERAVEEHDLGRAVAAGLHVVARLQDHSRPRLLPFAAVAATVLDSALDGDELRLAARRARRRRVENREQQRRGCGAPPPTAPAKSPPAKAADASALPLRAASSSSTNGVGRALALGAREQALDLVEQQAGLALLRRVPPTAGKGPSRRSRRPPRSQDHRRRARCRARSCTSRAFFDRTDWSAMRLLETRPGGRIEALILLEVTPSSHGSRRGGSLAPGRARRLAPSFSVRPRMIELRPGPAVRSPRCSKCCATT